jgi:hypothetical protein
MNGLIRQYFPKGESLKKETDGFKPSTRTKNLMSRNEALKENDQTYMSKNKTFTKN